MSAEPAMPIEEQPEPEPDPEAGRRFLDLAKRLIAVPKHEIDRQRTARDTPRHPPREQS